MTKLIKEEGASGRLHIDTPMMGESLVSKAFLKQTEAKEYFRMHPDINVLKIGGQSIMDRGAKALLPILDVLIEAKDKHKILLMTGGGTRARHVYNLEQLTMFCKLGYLPITYGIPPYGFFEHPAEHGSIPPHRTDCGAFLLAENIGARSLIFLKDEKGLYDQDPKKAATSADAPPKFIDRISAKALLELDLDDLIIERPILAMLQRAKCLKELQIIDALHHPEDILAALEGQHVGTIIYKET
jgi:molybdenum storage protein